jgi:hypothetical protein
VRVIRFIDKIEPVDSLLHCFDSHPAIIAGFGHDGGPRKPELAAG